MAPAAGLVVFQRAVRDGRGAAGVVGDAGAGPAADQARDAGRAVVVVAAAGEFSVNVLLLTVSVFWPGVLEPPFVETVVTRVK